MTESVKALMEKLFEGAPDTEEIRSLREEITNNCEEHFQDLTARGLDEEDAAAEIAASLRGMEEVVADLSRKARAVPVEKADAPAAKEAEPLADPELCPPCLEVEEKAPAAGTLTFPVDGLKVLKVLANSDDLELGTSEDQLLHVCWDPESSAEVYPEQKGETLVLSVRHHLNTEEDSESVKQSFSCDLEKGSISINFKDLFGKVKGLLRSGIQALEPVSVRILVPAGSLVSLDASSRSGDVSVEGCGFKSIRVSSVSGDASCRETAVLDDLHCSSTSGDLYADAFAESMTLSTLSGDIEVRGGAVSADIKTTSGDVELQGGLARAAVTTVSGDLDISLHSRLRLECLRLRSTSGDVDLNLDEGCKACFALNTVSGDITNTLENDPAGAAVQINTVSGDITVS